MLSGTVQIDGSQFISGKLTDGSFVGKVEFIQTDNIITVTFTISNAIPTYESGVYHPRVIIVMPQGFVESGTAQVSNLDGSMRTLTAGRETEFK